MTAPAVRPRTKNRCKAHIAIERPDDADPIDAWMRIKAAILNGDDRLDEVRRNVGDLDELSFFALRRKKLADELWLQVNSSDLLFAP